MNNLLLVVTISLLVSFSHAIESDFCVSDTSLPKGPNGYSCKDPSTVTTDDFVFNGFRGERTIDNAFGSNLTFAFADQFPALNGLDLSMIRLDIGVGGSIPIHSHRASEVIVVIKGSIIAGFIDTNNVAYYKKLEVGDVMIFPQGMLHFQFNNGKIPALAFVSLNSANPGVQITSLSLFGGNLPASLVEPITLLSSKEIKRMRKLFGAS